MDKECTSIPKHYEQIEEYDEHGRLVRAEGYIPPEYRNYQSDYIMGKQKSPKVILFPVIFLLTLTALCLTGILYFSLPVTMKIVFGIFAVAFFVFTILCLKQLFEN